MKSIKEKMEEDQWFCFNCDKTHLVGQTCYPHKVINDFVEELKPCPFCGVIPDKIEKFSDEHGYGIYCENDKCRPDVYTWGHMTKEAAIKSWNQRIK